MVSFVKITIVYYFFVNTYVIIITGTLFHVFCTLYYTSISSFWILFSHGRKPRSNYRRPSSLGLANTPLPDKSEAKHEFTPLTSGRSHIVAPLKDHLRPEGSFEMTSEGQSQYRNLSPSRPVIHKLKDHLKVRADFVFTIISHFSSMPKKNSSN